jgi:hypothetical protein
MRLEKNFIILEKLNDVSERVNREDIASKVEVKIAKPLEQANAKSSFKNMSIEDFHAQFVSTSGLIGTGMRTFFINLDKK